MPLSIPFLVYAFISGVSMRQLSMSGLVPGLFMAIALMGVCVWYGKKTGCDNGDVRSSPRQIWAATRDAGPALVMPLIIVGGIWSGVFTPTESAAVAVVYGIIVSLFVYRDIQLRDLPRLLVNAFQTSATVMLVIGATGALAWLITAEQVAVQLAAWIKLVADQPWQFLFLLNVALLLLGIFIEPLPAMLLTVPLLLPIAKTFGIDLVHLGVVITANLAIALYTPPVGGTLFVAAKLADAGIGEITKALWPLLIAAVVVLFVITYLPWSTSVIWRMVN
jgi:C4-dicarboxylate transporter DctM subunit